MSQSTPATPTGAPTGTPGLQKGLQQRHLTMIAIGGVIGAGLFVGSGVVISETGPAAFLSYAVTGLLIILVMRMLGEMATAHPSTGSFADYARRALGGWAGFSTAWLYWYFWVIVVGFEAVAGAEILRFWIDAPLWLLSLVLMVLMTATNLFSVRSYGEFEYWFAGIKVAAIMVFLFLGTLFVLGLWPDQSFDVSNMTDHGGFFPNGVGAIFSSIVVVVFSMVGAEIATIAAAESKDPKRAIAKATQSVILRVATFFVGSMILLVCIVPWDDNELGASPYVAAFERDGHPVRRPHHERGRPHGRALLPQLRAVHRLADAVRAGRAARGAEAAGPGERPGRADVGDPVLHRHRLPQRDRGVRLARHGLPVPAELLGRGDPVRLPADRDLPAGAAASYARRRAGRADVGLPVPDDRDDPRRAGGAGAARRELRHPLPAAARPRLVGRRAGAVRHHPEAGRLAVHRGAGGQARARGEPSGGADARSGVAHLDRDRARLAHGLLEHVALRVGHRQPGLDDRRGAPSRGSVEHLVDGGVVAAGHDGGRRGSSPRMRAACPAAASYAWRAWLSRRRANRCWLCPPALVRPWTWRWPTLDSTIRSPASRATANPPLRTSSTPHAAGAVTSAANAAASGSPSYSSSNGQPRRERRPVGRRAVQRPVADGQPGRAVPAVEVEHPALERAAGIRTELTRQP